MRGASLQAVVAADGGRGVIAHGLPIYVALEPVDMQALFDVIHRGVALTPRPARPRHR